jgi:hypothetical protein
LKDNIKFAESYIKDISIGVAYKAADSLIDIAVLFSMINGCFIVKDMIWEEDINAIYDCEKIIEIVAAWCK